MECGDCAKEELHYLLSRDELRYPFVEIFFDIFWPSEATLLMFANKQDLAGALNASELRERMDLDRLCSSRSWYVQPCCALTGDGLLHGFEWLAAELKKVKK
jgi:signal recognition particle receptor subunit beta